MFRNTEINDTVICHSQFFNSISVNNWINQRSGGGKNTQKILLDGFYLLFEENLQEKKNLFFNLAETVPIRRPRLWRKSARKIKFNLIINLIIEQL